MSIDDIIRKREVVSLAELAHLLSTDSTTIQHELDAPLRAGRIERLQPVATAPHSPDGRAVFYRWKRPSDADYLWEKDLATLCRERKPQISRGAPPSRARPWSSRDPVQTLAAPRRGPTGRTLTALSHAFLTIGQ